MIKILKSISRCLGLAKPPRDTGHQRLVRIISKIKELCMEVEQETGVMVQSIYIGSLRVHDIQMNCNGMIGGINFLQEWAEDSTPEKVKEKILETALDLKRAAT